MSKATWKARAKSYKRRLEAQERREMQRWEHPSGALISLRKLDEVSLCCEAHFGGVVILQIVTSDMLRALTVLYEQLDEAIAKRKVEMERLRALMPALSEQLSRDFDKHVPKMVVVGGAR